MMSNLSKVYKSAVHKEFVSYIQHQKYKFNGGENIYKDKLMELVINKYKNMCTKYKWLADSTEEQYIVVISV